MDSTDEALLAEGSPRSAHQTARRLAILDAAKDVFFDQGYQLASMDRIAEAAATTKRTLYAYFPNKEALFGAVVAKGCAHVLSQLPDPEQLPVDPRQGLTAFARVSAELMASPGCIKLERLIVAEAERHPLFAATLAQAFDAGEAKLAAYLQAGIAAGRLKPHDPRLGARLLSGAIGLSSNLKALLAAQPSPDAKALAEQAAQAAIALYLEVYATGGGGAATP